MKKTILAIALTFATMGTTFAADFVNITTITKNANNTTTVIADRVYTDSTGKDNLMMTFGYTFNGNLSAQTAVDKMALFCDQNITVRTNLASTTQKVGQVGILSKALSDAWHKDGLAGYFAELNKQIANQGLFN